LGKAVKPLAAIPGGYQREYNGGIVYYDSTNPSATSEVHGEILLRYLVTGGPAGSLGFPRTSQMNGAHGVGQYNHFAQGSIYWCPLLGAYIVSGAIRDKWLELGAEGGPLGYPTSDVQNLGIQGAMCRFQYGSIYQSPLRGAHYLYGPILQKWTDSDTERGSYGYPIEDPYTIGDKWYQRFDHGTLAVDSRSRDFRTEIARRGIGIRNQGGRGTCSIFAMTFLLEYAYTEMLGSGYSDLSEEYMNHVANVATGKTDDGDIFGSVAAGYENFGVIKEFEMPYNPNLVYDFNAVTITPQMYAEGLSLLQNGLHLEGHFVVPLGEAGATQEQFDSLLSYVSRGIPVAVGRSHSLAAVGYKYDPTWDGGGYLIFKNSYGPTSDENGYKRESFASVKSTVNDAYVYEQPYKVDWTPPEEVAAYWKLDDASGTIATDSSGNGHSGTLKGGPTWTTGMRGGALMLDGKDDYVDCGDLQDLPSGRAPRTVCAWAKTDTIASGWRWIVSYGTGGQGQAMFLGMNGNSLYGGGYSDDLQLNGFWSPGIWQHVCLTYDGTTARLYANGQQVASSLKTWNLVLNRVCIGRQVNDAAEFWDGAVDDVRIYRRALPQSDVKAIMDGKPVPDSSTITVAP
jgi:C1A family cysteine protease